MRARPAELILLIASVVLALAAVEGGLRLTGLGPWRAFASFDAMPTLTVADAELGWVNRPGDYAYTRPDGADVRVHITPSGARGARDQGRTWIMGGSFAYGFGVTDAQTVTAQLDRLRPDLQAVNRAVPGYGTAQSALLWRRLGGPADVVYGLTDLHDGRNVAAGAWLHTLDRAGPHHDWAGVPAAEWDGQRLQRRPPQRYRHWPLSESIALVDLVERATLRVQDRLLRTKSETTMQLVREWRDAVEAQGGSFVVALLHAPDRERYYRRRLQELGVRFIDIQDPRFPDAAIPEDGHPDETIHAAWAAALAEAL
jgi:hypothetical protein